MVLSVRAGGARGWGIGARSSKVEPTLAPIEKERVGPKSSIVTTSQRVKSVRL